MKEKFFKFNDLKFHAIASATDETAMFVSVLVKYAFKRVNVRWCSGSPGWFWVNFRWLILWLIVSWRFSELADYREIDITFPNREDVSCSTVSRIPRESLKWIFLKIFSLGVLLHDSKTSDLLSRRLLHFFGKWWCRFWFWRQLRTEKLDSTEQLAIVKRSRYVTSAL